MRSAESLVDPNTRLKNLIEDKYMGRLSQWQMSYFCRPSMIPVEPKIDSDLTNYKLNEKRRQQNSCRRGGSLSEELEKTLMRHSNTYWYANQRLKRKAPL